MNNNECEAVIEFNKLYKRAGACGLTLKTDSGIFSFKDIPNAKLPVEFGYLSDVRTFIRGYELGYNSTISRSPI